MAQLSDSALAILATAIQNATNEGSNTATIVGQFLNDLVDSKINKNIYKEYVARISQSGSADPTIDAVINNTYTGGITLPRASAGAYSLTSASSEFVAGKTSAVISNGTNGNGQVEAQYSTISIVNVASRNSSGTATDSIISGATLIVRTYL